VLFLDSLQMVNSSIDSIAKNMLGKEKIDTGYKTYTKDLLVKWHSEKTGWNLFKEDLARDCVLFIEILHILADLF